MSDHTLATTAAKSAPIILCGPQAVGKTRHAQPIAAALGCERIVDDWNGRDELRDGTLAITNAEYSMPAGGIGIHVEDAEGIDTLLAVLGRHQPKLVRPPYSTAFITCTCGAVIKDDCTCRLDTSLTDALRDWVSAQQKPFSIDDAAQKGIGLHPPKLTRDLRTRIGVALLKLGCQKVDVAEATAAGIDQKRLYWPPSKPADQSAINAPTSSSEENPAQRARDFLSSLPSPNGTAVGWLLQALDENQIRAALDQPVQQQPTGPIPRLRLALQSIRQSVASRIFRPHHAPGKKQQHSTGAES